MRLRMASRRTRDSSWLNHRGQRALVLRDADPSGSAPQDEGIEILYWQGWDPGSPLRSGRDDRGGVERIRPRPLILRSHAASHGVSKDEGFQQAQAPAPIDTLAPR